MNASQDSTRNNNGMNNNANNLGSFSIGNNNNNAGHISILNSNNNNSGMNSSNN